MKTVNFLEALEANKTRRIRFVNGGEWISVGSYRNSVDKGYGGMLEAIEGKWQIEPEAIEFECEWQETPSREVIPTSINDEQDLNLILLDVVGKRTKVRIEVLGDE